MKILKKIYAWIVEIQSWIAIALLTAAILLNAYEIFQRNFLDKSFIWLQEYSTLMLLWFALLGMSKIVYDQEDIYVDLFVRKFPATLRKIINLLLYGCITIFLAVATVYTYKLFLSQEGNYTIVAEYPLQLRSLALLIGFVTMGIKNLSLFIESILALGSKAGREEGTV